MRANINRALVFGGTGTVGSAVLRLLAESKIETSFTYHQGKARAEALSAELGHHAAQVDLGSADEIRSLIDGLDKDGMSPDLFVHCAAISENQSLDQITDADWARLISVNSTSAFIACQALAKKMAKTGGHMVLVGAMDRTQSFPAPVHFAASQGMLSAMTMALGKALGPQGIFVNMVALGPLTAGLSRQLLEGVLSDYKNFSALRRLGTPEEAARAIVWLALENTYMNGRVLSVNGGI